MLSNNDLVTSLAIAGESVRARDRLRIQLRVDNAAETLDMLIRNLRNQDSGVVLGAVEMITWIFNFYCVSDEQLLPSEIVNSNTESDKSNCDLLLIGQTLSSTASNPFYKKCLLHHLIDVTEKRWQYTLRETAAITFLDVSLHLLLSYGEIVDLEKHLISATAMFGRDSNIYQLIDSGIEMLYLNLCAENGSFYKENFD